MGVLVGLFEGDGSETGNIFYFGLNGLRHNTDNYGFPVQLAHQMEHCKGLLEK